MPHQPLNVSVTAPISPALERVKMLLFRPFVFQTWLVLGFCAWLDQLGKVSAGGGTGFRFGNQQGVSWKSIFDQVREYILSNLGWLIPVAVAVGVLGVAIWLAVTWLSSRGQFMFLDNVATNRREMALPWTQYAPHADSLFIFRAVFGLAVLLILVPSVLFSFWMINQLVASQGGTPLPVVGLVVVGMGGVGLGVVAAIIQKLTRDFVVPIMYLQTPSLIEGWRRLSNLLADHALDFFIYLLFSIVLAIGVGLFILAVVIVTCCFAGCLMAIPFVGTVLLLPIHVFTRSYSAYYLAQFGPAFDLFTPPSSLAASPS